MVITRIDWGNFWTISGEAATLTGHLVLILISLVFIWLACWFLFRARQRETSPLARRHMLYILIGFLAISFFYITMFSMFIDLKASL